MILFSFEMETSFVIFDWFDCKSRLQRSINYFFSNSSALLSFISCTRVYLLVPIRHLYSPRRFLNHNQAELFIMAGRSLCLMKDWSSVHFFILWGQNSFFSPQSHISTCENEFLNFQTIKLKLQLSVESLIDQLWKKEKKGIKFV